MYFTLAVSAATRHACAALAEAAERADPRVMPIPGPARVTWRAPDGRAAVLHWGGGRPPWARKPGTSQAGTIWAEGTTVQARTGLTRVDPVYLAEVVGAAVVSDRACWAAAVTGRLGDPGHSDVVVAGLIAGRLGVEHTVTRPRPPGARDEADVLRRLRAAVLVSDGMLSAFENVGWPDPQSADGPAEAGGHGGELLRGGYAQAAWRTPAGLRVAAVPLDAVAAAELLRRMTTRRLSLLRPGPARAYLTSLAPSAAALARGPLAALDDFYLVNRAGRWSAAARQAYLLRSQLIQPLFADRVVRAARAVPLRDRMSDRLHRDVLGLLCPELLGLPLAGTPWHGEPRIAATVLTAPAGAAAADWRRDYGDAVAGFLRGYVLDHGETSPVFGIVRRSAAERLLRAPQADRHGIWALATLTALLSGDWLNAREPASQALIR